MEPIILPRISDRKPLVTVVSITYNHESYIRDCLEGFLMQKTSFPVEVIIHDDASTDHTAEIIREYYEKRPDLFYVIIEKENQFSKNKIISLPLYKQAQGKYIAFCEGDDYWTDPLKLQKQFDFLEKNQDYIASVHRFDVVDKHGSPLSVKTFGFYNEDQTGKFSLKDLGTIEGLPSHMNTLMFRNVFLDKNVVYPEELKKNGFYGDRKLFFLLLLHGDIYRAKEKMSSYRHVCEAGGSSWSSRQIGKNNAYERWKNDIDLEKIAKNYNKEIYFKTRRLNVGPELVYGVLRERSLKSIINLIHYCTMQRGAILHILYRSFGAIKRRICTC